MADRFWVGGTATWDSTAGTKWATTSGGGGGASVPGTGDTAIFDANSGAVTVTKGATANTIGALNMTGSAATIAWASRTLTVDTGDVTLVAAKCSGTVSFTFTAAADQALNADNYASFGTILRGGGSGTTQKLICGSGFTCTTLQCNRAVLDLNGQNVKAATFTFGTGTVTRNLLFNGATLQCTVFTANSGSGFTITPDTGKIYGLGGLQLQAVSGLSMPAVEVMTTALSGTVQFDCASTIPSFSWVPDPADGGTRSIQLLQNLTCSGTFFVYGRKAGSVDLRSDTAGVARTLTVNGHADLRAIQGNTNGIKDITAAGNTPFYAHEGSLDGGNNTNITFSDNDPSTLVMMDGLGSYSLQGAL